MERRSYKLRDGILSALHFGDTSSPVELVFLHANGFNAQSYRTIMETLGVHSVVFDMRGHGHSRDMPQPMTMQNWHIFREDCIEFFDRHLAAMTDGPVVLGGHSFGAVTAVLTTPSLQDRLRGFVGFDPVCVPFIFRLTSGLPGGRAYMKRRVKIARKAGQRRSVFDSPENAFQHWHGRGAFRDMPDQVLKDYIAGGLMQRSDGQWELACDPKWEQAIFVAQWHNIFKAARSLPDNSEIMFAGHRGAVSTAGTRRAIQDARPKITVKFDKGLGHLFPFIQTDMAAQALRRILSPS